MLNVGEATERLRMSGLRITPQRRAVIDALVGDDTHPHAEVVAERVGRLMPNVSLSTVYKTLHELADRGLVTRLDLPGGMRFDPDEHPHPHFVCKDCGVVLDAHLAEDPTSRLLRAASTEMFSAESVAIEFRGTCKACAAL